MYLLTANDRDWRKYWETMPGGAEEALVQLKKKFDEKKCDKYIFNVDLMLPPVYFDLVQCLLENAKPFTSKELGWSSPTMGRTSSSLATTGRAPSCAI